MTDVWPQTATCPSCQTTMRGTPIPDNYRKYHAPGSTHYSRLIGVEVRGVYDGTLYWQCPDCGHRWNRWPEGHPRYAVAERAIAQVAS